MPMKMCDNDEFTGFPPTLEGVKGAVVIKELGGLSKNPKMILFSKL